MDLSGFAWHQIGPTGTMTAAHTVRTFECSVEEFIERSMRGDQPPTEWKRCLYLEWFSQNGRVVIELPDPIITFIEEDGKETVSEHASPLPIEIDTMEPIGEFGLGVTTISRDDDDEWHVKEEFFREGDELGDEASRDGASGDESHGALERHLEREAREIERAIRGEEGERDVVDELELMDDLIERGGGEPIASLFSHRERLPKAETLSEEAAYRLLKVLLVEMAMYGIAYHVCEHFSARDAYRLLVEIASKEETFHPELQGTGWVQNFTTSDWCAECEAQVEADYEREDGKG